MLKEMGSDARVIDWASGMSTTTAYRKSTLRTILILVGCITAFIVSPNAASADLDCDDFASRADAQRSLESQPGDPNNLDADRDGKACEPYSGSNNPYEERVYGDERWDSYATSDAQRYDQTYSDYLDRQMWEEEQRSALLDDPKLNYQEPKELHISITAWKWIGVSIVALIIGGAVWEKVSEWWLLR